MNLRSLAIALSKIDPNGVANFTTRSTQAGRVFIASNLDAFRHSLEQAARIPAVRRLYDLTFENTALFRRIGDELEFSESEFRALQSASLALQNMVPAMREALSNIVGDEAENTIYIRLPDSDDLKYVAKVLAELEKIIGQAIYHPKIDGKVSLVGWEKGSLWIEIMVGTSLAAVVVSHVVKSAAIAYRRILENQLIEAQISGIRAKSESMEDIKNGLKNHLDMLVDAEARQIYDAHYRDGEQNVDNEQIERLKHTVKTLAELMNAGAEVQPGLLLPPEVKETFPNMKQLPSIVSAIKELGNGAK